MGAYCLNNTIFPQLKQPTTHQNLLQRRTPGRATTKRKTWPPGRAWL